MRAITRARGVRLFVAFSFVFLAAEIIAGQPPAVAAQRLSFTPARTSLVRRGAVYPGREGRATAEYSFRAKKGQRLKIALTSDKVKIGVDELRAVFFVLDQNDVPPPDFGDFPYGGPTAYAGRIAETGEYRVRVSLEDAPDFPGARTLRKMNLVVRYTIRITLQ